MGKGAEPGRALQTCRSWCGRPLGEAAGTGSENVGGSGVRDSAKARGSVRALLGCELGFQGRAWVLSGAPG